MNDAVRFFIDRFIALCAIGFRAALFCRIKLFYWNQRRLRRQYGVLHTTPVSRYSNTPTQEDVDYAFTSGSTTDPKKIPYTRSRLRKTRFSFIDVYFRYLSQIPPPRTLFIFSPFKTDRSLTALLLRESALPPYVCGLQAPHRVQNHPAMQLAAAKYGETAVRFWILLSASPGMLFATNPSTIAIFFREVYENWSKSRQMIADFVERPSNDLLSIFRRICSRNATRRLRDVAESEVPLTVGSMFPSLRAFSCWDGGYVAPFLAEVRKYLPSDHFRHFAMYSMSTETIETIAGPHDTFLPIAPGVLYEFIEEGKEDLAVNLLQPSELAPGKFYSMVVSNQYGLCRYQTEDLFECKGVVSGIPDLRFARRRNLSYSFTGEKLTADQLKLAYHYGELHHPELRSNGFFTCFPTLHPTPHYRLVYVKTTSEKYGLARDLASDIEQKLGEFNAEFKSKIESGRLGQMTVESIPIAEFVERLSGSGMQFKFLPLYPKLWESL